MRYSISSTLDDFDYCRRPVWVTTCAGVRAGTPSGQRGDPTLPPGRVNCMRRDTAMADGMESVGNMSRTTTVTSKKPTTVTTHSIKAPPPVAGLVQHSSALTESTSPGTTSLIRPVVHGHVIPQGQP